MISFSERDTDLAHARARSVAASPTPGQEVVLGTILSYLMKHGGAYSLADKEMMSQRLTALLGANNPRLPAMLAQIGSIPQQFFYNMVDAPYQLHSRLISYLSYPNRHLGPACGAAPSGPGKTFSPNNEPGKISAVFTFVGQFIDHDLTLNAVNLFGLQSGVVPSEATPLVDLDNVYGPRIDDANMGKPREVPITDGAFNLRPIQGGYDVCRGPVMVQNYDGTITTQLNAARIADKRNDENQILLQVHLLVMRLHNALLHQIAQNTGKPQAECFAQAREQTILHWQSMVVTDYLTRVIQPAALNAVLTRIQTADPKRVYQPTLAPGNNMPHEFAIGFRFGHSQLRSEYALNPTHCFALFDSLSDGTDDLQGGKYLTPDRLIDWAFFLGIKDNEIDTLVNEAMFDLPESTIPDQMKLVGNLPFRNLVRSNSVHLCAGEDLAERYAQAGYNVSPLTPIQVEPDQTKHSIFKLDGTSPNEDGTQKFRTPLWYYILREAEVARSFAASPTLGPLGSHLIAEVILTAIHNSGAAVNAAKPRTYLTDPSWHAMIPLQSGGNRDVSMIDIANFVASSPFVAPACVAGM